MTGVFAAVRLAGSETVVLGRQVGLQALACALAAILSGE